MAGAFVLSCVTCGKEFFVYKSGLKTRFCSKTCYHKSWVGRRHSEAAKAKMRDADRPQWATGESAINWKGGRTIDSRGYVLIYMPEHPNAVGNYVAEHRLVMEQHLGRLLTSDEEVHHDNEDVADNRIENLALLSKSEHTKLHLARERARGVNRFRKL